MILVATTAFKGTHSAADVAAAAARGARAAGRPNVRELPVSDGGPGLIDSLCAAGWRVVERVPVTGSLGSTVVARIASNGREAAVESADACGLALVPPAERDPLRATSFGVGELLARASAQFEHVFVGLGGSATIDGGLGMAAALGWQLLNSQGGAIERSGRGVLELDHIGKIEQKRMRVTALADVRNPLYGPAGAARVFGAQKGASAQQIEALDRGLQTVAAVIQRDLGIDVGQLPGAGAAGGLGAGLHAFAGATIVSGSDWVLTQLRFDELLEKAQLVITGEGSFDAQSSMGKITGELIARADRRGVPVLLIAGHVEGTLPGHVSAVGNAALELADIERLVREALPELLAP